MGTGWRRAACPRWPRGGRALGGSSSAEPLKPRAHPVAAVLALVEPALLARLLRLRIAVAGAGHRVPEHLEPRAREGAHGVVVGDAPHARDEVRPAGVPRLPRRAGAGGVLRTLTLFH